MHCVIPCNDRLCQTQQVRRLSAAYMSTKIRLFFDVVPPPTKGERKERRGGKERKGEEKKEGEGEKGAKRR